MKKIVKYKDLEFEYDAIELSNETNLAMDRNDAIQLLVLVRDILSQKGLTIYLTFGTLLGAVREGGMIAHDEDIDIFVDDEDKLFQCLSILENNGISLIRVLHGRVYSFKLIKSSGYIDIYIRRSLGFCFWKLYCCALNGNVTPKKYFQDSQKISFMGEVFLCPKNPEKLLEFWYGKSWRIPVRRHKFIYEVKSHYYWRNIIWPLIFECIGWPYWRHLIYRERYITQNESIRAWNKLYHNDRKK